MSMRLSLFSRARHSIIFDFLITTVMFLVFPVVSVAQTAVPCTSSFSDCGPIPENVSLLFPISQGFLAISGDVALAPNSNSNLNSVRDVFRLDNNFINTGAGTGLGFTGFLFSGELSVPPISSYSANAVEIRETPEGHGDTVYFGNGTNYHLGTGVSSAASGSGTSAPVKNAKLQLTDGDIAVSSSMGAPLEQGPAQDPGQADGLAFYSANYTSLGGQQLPFQIVGTDPSRGAATTTIPTVIVPIKVVYQLAHGLFLDGTSVAQATVNSPIFQNADYTVGGTDLGVTQWSDAMQRGEFFNLPGFSADYHVLLGAPTIAQTITVTVTNTHDGNLFRLKSGGLIGVVRSGFLNAAMNAQLHNYAASMLPIFLTDNVFESADGKLDECCVLGFHSSQFGSNATAKTWIYNAYTESGTFVNNVILDVQPLSHEVAEWLNDPFVGAGLTLGSLNFIPPALLPGQGGACIINFETGDPLEAPPAVLTKVTNGTTYHLQDEVFLPWYLHSTPSFSVNGWYTLQNTFTSFSSLCGPG